MLKTLTPEDFFRVGGNYSKFALLASHWKPGRRNGNFSRNITITSHAKAGKSTLLANLKKDLPGTQFTSGGDYFRLLQRQQGVSTIEAFAAIQDKDPHKKADYECERYQCQQVLLYDLQVIESRNAHCIDPEACHVKLTCDLSIRATRWYRKLVELEQHIDDITGKEITVGKIMTDIYQRDEKDKRLSQIYPGSDWPDSDFDIIIDTGKYGPEETVEKLLTGYSAWLNRTRAAAYESRSTQAFASA